MGGELRRWTFFLMRVLDIARDDADDGRNQVPRLHNAIHKRPGPSLCGLLGYSGRNWRDPDPIGGGFWGGSGETYMYPAISLGRDRRLTKFARSLTSFALWTLSLAIGGVLVGGFLQRGFPNRIIPCRE